jgi:hypothetical protein
MTEYRWMVVAGVLAVCVSASTAAVGAGLAKRLRDEKRASQSRSGLQLAQASPAQSPAAEQSPAAPGGGPMGGTGPGMGRGRRGMGGGGPGMGRGPIHSQEYREQRRMMREQHRKEREAMRKRHREEMRQMMRGGPSPAAEQSPAAAKP